MSSSQRRSDMVRKNIHDLRVLLSDPCVPRPVRLLMLQGQRGRGLELALKAGVMARLGPAQCAATAILALVLAEPWLFYAWALLAAVGAVSPHHPVEWVQVWWAGRRRGSPLPPNRAARRFACALGAVFFASAGLTLASNLEGLFWFFALSIVLVPAVVMTTNVCLPSMVFSVLFGVERASAPTLGSALVRPFRLGGTSARPAA